MIRKLFFGGLWLIGILYAFRFAPPDRPETLDLIIDLSSGNWAGINPIVIALFNLMGVLPFAYGCLLFADGRGQKIGAWPFAAASFGVGAFAILPYLALRQPNPHFTGEKNAVLKFWDSRILGVVLTLVSIVCLVYGFTQGDWADFVTQWQTSRFIHVMSLDFCMLCLLVPTLLDDDMARRELHDRSTFWLAAFVPLLGLLVYLCLRPPLPETAEPAVELAS
ncbi:MAG: DUF2834 domain-containing protein [Cyanobacteria bacterium SID2]|nr:DUF2834 domain-containing protein [Cyanobacteria bacterium SID2]MBP0004733.1 DUF2834 domain-containing protein [Cyanobacteria bacterium SBC]